MVSDKSAASERVRSKGLAVALFVMSLYPHFSMAIEEPSYTVRKKYDQFEVRQYDATLAAQTIVSEGFEDAGNKAFRVLADYIFGKNVSKTKMDMTAPVTQQNEKIAMTAPVNLSRLGEGYVVQFMMPSKYTLETLPAPIDPRVTIVTLPARQVAVYSYSGSWSEERYNQKLAVFQEALKKENIQTIGQPVFARFNSPFQLWFLRRNEIWIEVAP